MANERKVETYEEKDYKNEIIAGVVTLGMTTIGTALSGGIPSQHGVKVTEADGTVTKYPTDSAEEAKQLRADMGRK